MTDKIAYENLRREMVREGITISRLSTMIKMERVRLGRKLSMRVAISLEEADRISSCFPGHDILYLFAESFKK